MIPLVLIGAAGRMGQAIELAVAGRPEFEIAARVERAENRETLAGVCTDDAAAVIRPGVVVVDFSRPDAAEASVRLCAARGVPFVSGTTGLDSNQQLAIAEAARSVAVVHANNFSLGIAALRRALRAALAAVPAGWDVEIVERHHRLKKDSPSGTAKTLTADVLALRGAGPVRHGREGHVGERPAGEIGVHAVRGGSWVGDHEVLLAGEGEWLELRHVAQDRAAFAHGALAAAAFVAVAGPGLYTIDDILGGPGRRTP